MLNKTKSRAGGGMKHTCNVPFISQKRRKCQGLPGMGDELGHRCVKYIVQCCNDSPRKNSNGNAYRGCLCTVEWGAGGMEEELFLFI